MFGLASFSTGMSLIDAQDDFRRARRSRAAARLGHYVTGRGAEGRTPRVLSGGDALAAGTARLEVVPLECIIGTVEPSTGFDARFRPASEHVRKRWERVARAHRTGVGLPPISLVRRPDGDYVVDGRHRVSVARALGHRDIEAWVRRGEAAR